MASNKPDRLPTPEQIDGAGTETVGQFTWETSIDVAKPAKRRTVNDGFGTLSRKPALGRNESLAQKLRTKDPYRMTREVQDLATAGIPKPPGLRWGGGRSEVKEETAAGRRGT
jgi:hypothetical protein